MMALEGIKVLDFCRNAPGMFATMILADMGADVLMVERPMDETRAAYERIRRRHRDAGRRASSRLLQRPPAQQAQYSPEPEGTRGAGDIPATGLRRRRRGGGLSSRRRGAAGSWLPAGAGNQPPRRLLLRLRVRTDWPLRADGRARHQLHLLRGRPWPHR